MDSASKRKYNSHYGQRKMKALLMLADNTVGLSQRVQAVQSFNDTIAMVKSASISDKAFSQINSFLLQNKITICTKLDEMLALLKSEKTAGTNITKLNFRHVAQKIMVNNFFTCVDEYEDVLIQRGEQYYGIQIAGIDHLAKNAMKLEGVSLDAPEIICYLERGWGAAIRRANTKMAGGVKAPVSIIRIPRERMGSISLAGSLVHEVGHQIAALFDLNAKMKNELALKYRQTKKEEWNIFGNWISEILADVFSVGKLGICSTMGLMQVMTLPSFLVFNLDLTDCHPFPYIRVKINCAAGKYLAPSLQWGELENVWDTYYNTSNLHKSAVQRIDNMLKIIPELIAIIMEFNPIKDKPLKIKQLFNTELLSWNNASKIYNGRLLKKRLYKMGCCEAFAALGQLKQKGFIKPEEEVNIVSELLQRFSKFKKGE
jgi:hypothetical protein